MEETEKGLYSREVAKSRQLNELLGLGIGIFQAGTNLFLNGIVLATLYYGGYLLSTSQMTPGDLMSFLVATQTMQRSLTQMSLLFGQVVRGTRKNVHQELIASNYLLKLLSICVFSLSFCMFNL